jgi:hypothetical protein
MIYKFFGYLTTLSQLQSVIYNTELRRMWKEAIVVYFKVS